MKTCSTCGADEKLHELKKKATEDHEHEMYALVCEVFVEKVANCPCCNYPQCGHEHGASLESLQAEAQQV